MKTRTKILSPLIILLILVSHIVLADDTMNSTLKKIPKQYLKTVNQALEKASDNQSELLLAIKKCPKNHIEALSFLLTNMLKDDLTTIKSDYLLENIEFAYKSFDNALWKNKISTPLFLNNILPYANVNESRDNWRADFYKRFSPLVKDCKSPGEATVKLNNEIWDMINVHYSPRPTKPEQSPYESIKLGIASCTGLSIILINACRAVGIPARFVGIPEWQHSKGNHSWVEIWDDGWHYIGASEKGPLDETWFTKRASESDPNDRRHSIYAISFKKTNLIFPPAWNKKVDYFYAENITHLYLTNEQHVNNVNLAIQVFKRPNGKRIATQVIIKRDNKIIGKGNSRDISNDTNDMLTFKLEADKKYNIELEINGEKIYKKYKTTEEKNQIIQIFEKNDH